MKGGRCVGQNRISARLPLSFSTFFAAEKRGAMDLRWLRSREFHSANNEFTNAWTKRKKFAARALQSKAVLVIPAPRVRSQRGNGNATLALDCLRIPLLRRAVRFRRRPALDVPTIERNILWRLAQLDGYACDVAVRVRVRPLAADPREPRPAPHGAEVRLTEPVESASAPQTQLERYGRIMRFANDANGSPRIFTAYTCHCMYLLIGTRFVCPSALIFVD